MIGFLNCIDKHRFRNFDREIDPMFRVNLSVFFEKFSFALLIAWNWSERVIGFIKGVLYS